LGSSSLANSARSASLVFGSIAIALDSDDRAAAEWLVEFLDPWFRRGVEDGEVHVTVSSSADAYAELADRRPPDAAPRACFALDQQVVSLPAWPVRDGVALADLKRSCFLVLTPSRIGIFGDPTTRRWRFTLQLVFHEIAATRARRTGLDLHAAAVEAGGRAIVMLGPKRAGKTTLSFHLLRSGSCRWIANDRAFAVNDGTPLTIRGMPTAVRIQPSMLRDFPELRRGLRDVERPYLHAVDEISGAIGAEQLDGSAEFALSPAQVAQQLNVEPLASAPLGAIVFPEIRPDTAGSAVERLEPTEVSAGICANLYGKPSGRQEPTLFEELDGGRGIPPRHLADALSEAAPGYRVILGRDAYAAPDFAARLLETLLP
jgi:hypothetical protein